MDPTVRESQVEAPVRNPLVRPYRASWLDHFFEWVRRLPGPAWLFYLALFVALALLFGALVWAGGVELVALTRAVDPVALAWLIGVDAAAYIVYYLALMHYLDRRAGRALRQFRPLLQVSDEAYLALQYNLTTLPAVGVLIAMGIGLLVTWLGLWLAPADVAVTQVVRQPASQVAFFIGNAILAVFVYHTVRQLNLVRRIHAMSTQISLFRRGPIYAFSKLTARTAFGWVWGLSLGLSPRFAPLLVEGNLMLLWLLVMPLAVLVFVWPLLGVQRLLAREKARLQEDVERRLEAILLRVHGQQDANEMMGMTELKTLLDTLLVERDVVARLPTWPWQLGTLAGLSSGLLLPVAIWLIQQLLTQWLPGA